LLLVEVVVLVRFILVVAVLEVFVLVLDFL
jgi:hypothetical protein